MIIAVGQIFQVVTNKFIGVQKSVAIPRINPNRERRCDISVYLKQGEYIEIRYPYEWHFRTVDNLYLHATTLEILNNCKYIGEIFQNIRSENKTELKEILDNNLYTNLFDELNELRNENKR